MRIKAALTIMEHCVVIVSRINNQLRVESVKGRGKLFVGIYTYVIIRSLIFMQTYKHNVY